MDPCRTALEMPATTALLPEVEGQRVLDAGCGAGRYTEWLVERGATVAGIDASDMILSRAVDRVGDRAAVRRTDLSEPRDFARDAFDGVVSALALSSVQYWEVVFAGFGWILKYGRFLVFSTGHPFNQFPPETDEGRRYFAIEPLSKDWDVEDPYYRRPLAAIGTTAAASRRTLFELMGKNMDSSTTVLSSLLRANTVDRSMPTDESTAASPFEFRCVCGARPGTERKPASADIDARVGCDACGRTYAVTITMLSDADTTQ